MYKHVDTDIETFDYIIAALSTVIVVLGIVVLLMPNKYLNENKLLENNELVVNINSLNVQDFDNLNLPQLKLGGGKVGKNKQKTSSKKSPNKTDSSTPSFDKETNDKEISQTDTNENSDSKESNNHENSDSKESDAKESDNNSDSNSSAPEGEGHPDGVKEGTETDPLKAQHISVYRSTLINYFQQGLSNSPDVPCNAYVSATINISDLTMSGFSLSEGVSSSFNNAVRTLLNSKNGKKLPPVPQRLQEIGYVPPSVIPVRFNPSKSNCKKE